MEVLQSGDVIVPSGESLTLNCSMGPGFSMSSYTMLWYRQERAGAPLQFLIKEYDQNKGRFSVSILPGENLFFLTVAELLVNDSSSYYCAARHSEAQSPNPCSKNYTTAGSSCSSQSLHREEPLVSKYRIVSKQKV